MPNRQAKRNKKFTEVLWRAGQLRFWCSQVETHKYEEHEVQDQREAKVYVFALRPESQ